MAQQAGSPEVQVMQQPSLVYSHLQVPHTRLHWTMVMPLTVQQQLHMPPASILQRFCRVAQATSSSHLQCIFMPSLHFSTLISQRGTTLAHILADCDAAAMVFQDDLREAVLTVRSELPALRHLIVQGGPAGHGIDWDVDRLLASPQYGEHYYAAFVIDSNGHNIEAVCQKAA